METCDHLDMPGDYEFVDADGHATGAGRQLIEEIKARTKSLESDFGGLRTQMQGYERLWRQQADRFQAPEDREYNQYLPAFPTPEARILGNKLVRANTKERVAFRCSLSAEWQQKTRDASQKLEKYWDGAFWMADQERYTSRRGYWQHAVAWQLTVRGVALTVAFVRASSRQANTSNADLYGDDNPFDLSTPDPYECVWTEDNTFFAQHNWRHRTTYLRWFGMDTLRANHAKRKEDLCDTYNCWWLDCEGNVWNTLVVEDCFAIAPVNHTQRRRLRNLPVVIDSAYGAPTEINLGDSDFVTLEGHYEGAFESVKNAYYVTNTVNAYQMRLLRDSVFWSLVTKTRGLGPDDETLRNIFRGRGAFNLAPDEDVKVLAPPQISESVLRWQQTLDKWKQMGGLPDATGTGVPEGASALFAAEIAQQGDAAAGPISDAIKRMALCAAKELLTQHSALRRTVRVSAATQRYGPYVMTFRPEDLPKPGEYVVEAQHDPYITKDDYREWQTALAMRTAGVAALTVFDKFLRDPVEEEHRRNDEMLKADPGVQALDMAAHAQRIGRQDLAAYFTKKAMMLLEGPGGGGRTNAPRGGPNPMGGPVPVPPEGLPAVPPESRPNGMNGGGPVNPQELATMAQLGQQGGGAGMMGGAY